MVLEITIQLYLDLPSQKPTKDRQFTYLEDTGISTVYLVLEFTTDLYLCRSSLKKKQGLVQEENQEPHLGSRCMFFFKKSVPGVLEFQTFLLIQLLELNNSGIHNPYTTYIIGKMLVALGWYP